MRSDIKVWFGSLARAGYATRGMIYAVIGFFAALAAIGGGEVMGSRDALDTLFDSAGGNLLAAMLIAGLAFYALWRFIQAVFDADGHGTDAKALAIRAGLLASAVTYATLASYTLSLMQGGDGGEGGGDWAQMLSGIVGGRAVSLMLALVLAGAGVAHIVKAVRERYARNMDADAAAMRIIHPVAKTGLIARGGIFMVLAFLLVTRSVSGGDQAGTRDALEFVQGLPFGWLLLSLTGAGLVAFAVYSFALARYRQVDVDRVPV